jgi:Flp pilus assembly protein TadD
MERHAQRQARDAEKALAAHDFAKAVTLAEAAVVGDNDNAAYRTLLGRVYLASGRLVSAQTAFQDAIALGSTDSRAIVSLALVQIAQGQTQAARDLLVAHVNTLSAADYGLAMAMAGDPDEAIRVLGQAIQDPAAGVKERQNLAYAYALAGRWNDARLMASQDMAPLAAAQRVALWASMAAPGAESQRVLAMMGVQPVAGDTGLPVALALASNAPAPVEMAQAQPVAVAPQDVQPAPAPMNEAAPAPQTFASVQPEAIPMIRAAQSPVKEPVAARPVRTVAVPASARSMVQNAALFRPAGAAQGSAWVVQLGAYDTAAVAKDAWQRFSRHNQTVGSLPSVTTSATVKGRIFHRLAVAGFANRAGAAQLCALGECEGQATTGGDALRRSCRSALAPFR